MELLVTSEQMQEFDRAAISGLAIPGLVLMENAGRAFVEELFRRRPSLRTERVLVLCGKGNNGGDGFVIARHLAGRGVRVTVVLLARPGDLRGDAAANFAALKKLARVSAGGLSVKTAGPRASFPALQRHDVVIDALFGTGFAGEPAGVYLRAIEWVNRIRAYVASVDIPSGINGSTGTAGKAAVRADLTITMGLPKVGHFTGVGRDFCGELAVVDIGIPGFLIKPMKRQAYLPGASDVRKALPSRARTAHKYSVGKVFVIGGSRTFTGAPAMAAMAALRSGAGAVVLAVPESIHPILAKKLTEVILLAVPETREGSISLDAADAVHERCEWADVIAIGPGMGRNASTDGLIRRLIVETEKPLVIDADALTAVAGQERLLKRRKGLTVLTPHAGELARLVGGSPDAIELDRIGAARDSARRFGSIVVLKGAPTVTASPSGDSYVNSTGNPGMATIGSGDVLTGVIAGLEAQGSDALASAWSGAFLHGMSGDIVAAKIGQRSLLATDILEALPEALRRVEGGA